MTDAETASRDRRYIACLNDRQLDGLDDFVNDEVTYNGRGMTRDDYRNMIARDIAAIPDLFFAIGLLVVAGDMVACRLNFDCTPQGEFLGLPPTGRRISFSEHVFYRIREGRIQEVWSPIDRPAAEAQLPA